MFRLRESVGSLFYDTVVESRSVHDQNTSWVIVGYPRWKNFTQCSFSYVFLRRRIFSEDEQDTRQREGEEQLDSLEDLHE